MDLLVATQSISLDVPYSSPQITYGVELLQNALTHTGHVLEENAAGSLRVLIAPRGTEEITKFEQDDVLLYNVNEPRTEGFALVRLPGNVVVVTGADDTGVLYGCQELARIVEREGTIPRDLDRSESPDMLMRGPAIGLQKTTVEPPRQVYEYPITHDRFPWFYDRDLWTTVLDRLFDDRANAIYLWSGHPFSSLVRTPGFPEAQEVSDEQLDDNQAVLHWLVDEAHRRGIRVFMKFYNIHIPLPFSEHHGIDLHQPRPTPLVSAYTRAAVAALVSEFPDMGLYVCLGEVLQGTLYGEEWLVETIIPGVKDAIAADGIVDHPPILLRSHHIDPGPVLDAARRHYPRIYTEAKYNGESLTTWNPRGEWQQQHQMLASKAAIHAANVHILADLEPFRYSAFSFIQRSTQAMAHRLHATGLHLYPLFYWDWPYSPDAVSPRLLQIDRDRLWFSAWFRYAWKADRDPLAERTHWDATLTEQFGDPTAGSAIVEALEAMGQITPRLIRRLGITEGNRQTFALGMTMSQLTHPELHRPWPDLWDSHAPGGERLDEFAAREVAGEPHTGETPIDVIEDARYFAARARAAISRAVPHVSRDRDEFDRIAADADALFELAEFTALRTLAAIEIVSYRVELNSGSTPDAARLERAVALVGESLDHYRRLVEITSTRYLYANSMRTPQRRVPFPDGEHNDHWVRCLPLYETEYRDLVVNIQNLHDAGSASTDGDQSAFTQLDSSLRIDGAQPFELGIGERLFSDVEGTVTGLAPELVGMRATRIARESNREGQVEFDITLPRDGHVLIGYFADTDPVWLQVPNLETNTHADARGGLEPVLKSAICSDQHPDVDVHAFRYEAGTHTIAAGAGAFLLVGVTEADQPFTGRTVFGSSDDDLSRIYASVGEAAS